MKYLNFANSVSNNNRPELLMSLIDLSPSMNETDYYPTRKDGAVKANKKLLEIKLRQNPKDKMGIIGFSETARLIHQPVCIGVGFGSLCNALDRADGTYGTNFTAALILAKNCLFRQYESKRASLLSKILPDMFINFDLHEDVGVIRRIILLSDGEYNQGGCPLQTACELKKAGVIIDCIGIGGSPDDIDEEVMKQIASRNPDGSIRYCFISDQEQLIRKYQSLAHHISVA
jgi:hypothetical protein